MPDYVKFQYVDCQLNALRSLSSAALIRQALEGLPAGLDATYDRILLNVDQNFQSQVMHSLEWLAFSFDTIHIGLLSKIFNLRPKEIPLDDAEEPFSVNDALKHFSSLVVVEGDYVRLARPSIKEYLVSSRIRNGPASAFSFTEADAHLYIAHSCLAYHLQCNAPGDTSAPRDEYELDGASKLKVYAARNWPLHLEMAPRSSWPLEVAQAANLALAVHSRSLLSMLNSLTMFSFSMEDAWLNPLIYTAHLGASQLTEMLIMSEFEEYPLITQHDLDAALASASAAGEIEVIRLLLGKGAGVDAQTAAHLAPLRAAAAAGKMAAVQFLLQDEAVPDTLRDNVARKSALEWAAIGNHFDIVELLVRHGVEVTERALGAVAESYRPAAVSLECLKLLLDHSDGIAKERALCKAALKGNWEAFELLLSRGADINAPGGHHGNPLYIACAAYDTDESRIEYLLGLGADPNVQGQENKTALQAACHSYSGRDEEASIKIAKLLMAHGVDVNVEGGEYGSALNHACASKGKDGVSWYNMAELLLQNGASVHAQEEGRYAHALQIACHRSNFDIVPLLLAWGADVNAERGTMPSPLTAACFTNPRAAGKEQEVDTVRLLLDRGAEINGPSKNKVLGSALQAASAAGNMKLVRLLLDRGAKADGQGNGYGTALQSACQWGQTEIARLLLERGADVNARGRRMGDRWRTALQIICSFFRCNDETVRLLLDHGADVINAGDVLYNAASSDGIKDNATLLRMLEMGADINEVDERRGTALHGVLQKSFADKDMKQSRIRVLVEHGADVFLAVGDLGSPLHCACAVPMNMSDMYANERTTALLLELCPEMDVNATGGKYGTALQAAAWSGQTESARLLIQKGGRVNIRGGKYWSALNAAIFRGHWDIVRLLCEHVAVPDYSYFHEPDETWLAEIQNEHGRAAVERYRKFWEEDMKNSLAKNK